MIIENRTGTAGNLAAEAVARADADGHTLLTVATAFAVNASLYTNLRYDPRKDFRPVSCSAQLRTSWLQTRSSPAAPCGELIAPGEVAAGQDRLRVGRCRDVRPSYGGVAEDHGRDRPRPRPLPVGQPGDLRS